MEFCYNLQSIKVMCYCNLTFLKCIITVGALLSIVTSLGLLILSIYISVTKNDMIDKASEGNMNTVLVGLYISAIVFLVLGFSGLYSSIKKSNNTCFLFIYLIGTFIFLLVFIGGAIFFFLAPAAIFGTDCTSGSKTTFVKDLYQLSIQVNKTFCQPACPCYLTEDNTALTKYFDLNGYNYTHNQQVSKATKYQDCQNKANDSQSNAILMGLMEEFLNCGGWCSNDAKKYYRFRNINDCTSQECLNDREGCHDKMEDFLTTKGQLIGIGMLGAMVVCLLNIVVACCIIYHPEKQNKKNFYTQMMT